jgi:hypothetical protein
MKILVFAPHAQIWKHAFPEALLLEALMQKNHQIVYVRCNGTFSSHCIPMISNHISHNAPIAVKKAICDECIRNATLLEKTFKFPAINLEDYLSEEDVFEINEIIKNITKENFKLLHLEGIKVGEIAAYQVLLRYKQSKSKEFTDEVWNEYLKQLDVTLRSYFSLRKIIQNEQPDRIMQYSGVYSVHSICRELGKFNNIPTYFYHAGLNQRDRLKNIIIARDHAMVYIKSLFVSWENLYRNKPCSKIPMEKVTNNFIDLIKGNSFLKYSRSKSNIRFDIRKTFDISNDKKIVLAILSSYDEHLAGDSIGAYKYDIKPLFETQVEWIKELISYFRNREDLFLIIRVHPREFPTMREKKLGVTSQHAKDLQKVLVDLPKNIVINWPADEISFYDLIEETNLFLSAFSSSAREITMLGLPVLTYNNEDVIEPVSVNYKGASLTEYFGLIDVLLRKRFDPDRIKIAYRWRALEQVYSHISIKESYNEKDDLLTLPEKYLKLFRRVIEKIFPDFIKKQNCFNRANKLVSSNIIEKLIVNQQWNITDLQESIIYEDIDEKEEVELLRSEIKRLMSHLYFSNEDVKNDSLQSYLTAFVS